MAATEGVDLLTEPLLHNPQLRVQVAESRLVSQSLILVEVTRVGDLLDYDRGDWLDPLMLARCMGLSRPRTPRRVLQEAKATLPPVAQAYLDWVHAPPTLYPRPARPFNWTPAPQTQLTPSPLHCESAA
ncbi:unnamed protein product [Lepidochelys kempii]